jgi:hypothetical protein
MTLATPAAAQTDADKATARTLGMEAQTALDNKDFRTAADRFHRAEELFPAPTLSLGLARAYVGLGKFVMAQEAFNRVLRAELGKNPPPAFVKAVEDAQRESAAIANKIGSVVVEVSGCEQPVVLLDDQPIPKAALGVRRSADVGSHTVKASADGCRPVEVTVVVPEGNEPASVRVVLERDPSAAAATASAGTAPSGFASQGSPTAASTGEDGGKSMRLWGWITAGVGVGAMAAGGMVAGVAAGQAGDLSAACPNNVCPPSEYGKVDSYNALTTASVALLAGGGVVALTGGALILLAPKAPPPPTTGAQKAAHGHPSLRFVPVVGIGTTGIRGSF